MNMEPGGVLRQSLRLSMYGIGLSPNEGICLYSYMILFFSPVFTIATLDCIKANTEYEVSIITHSNMSSYSLNIS